MGAVDRKLVAVTTWVIVGCGYVGSALAHRLAGEGHDVVVTRRDRAAARAAALAAGPRVSAEVIDLAQPGNALPGGAIVVCCAPPGPDPGAEMRRLAETAVERLVYLSSTAVYARGGGAWVDETWPTEPATAAGRVRLVAEVSIATPNHVALRVAGIHGPRRGLVDRIRAGTYRVIGDGSSHVSRIHVDDLVEAIVRAATSGVRGAVNIADDDPAPIGEVVDTIAARVGAPPPPRVAASDVDPELAGMLTADRRIANRRMKQELGVVLRYPSWRDAL